MKNFLKFRDDQKYGKTMDEYYVLLMVRVLFVLRLFLRVIFVRRHVTYFRPRKAKRRKMVLYV